MPGSKPEPSQLDAGQLKVTVLGCGTSTGVPVVGCDCEVCTSGHPRNQRLRPSLCLSWAGRNILIDTSTDLRQQCLRAEIRRVDAVLYTHAHADHIYGLDDLRPYNFRQGTSIPCYGSPATLDLLSKAFSYAFDGQPSEGGGKPRLELHPIGLGPFELSFDQLEAAENEGIASSGDRSRDLRFEAIAVWHGSLEVYAYRCGPFAYVTDTQLIPEAALRQLEGLDVLILDALRYRPHPTHFSLSEALEVVERLRPGRTWLTHMNHDIDYRTLEVNLPPGVELAYDGLSFELPLS